MIQGSASDLVKTAIIKIDRQLQKIFPNMKDHSLQNCLSVGNCKPNGAYLVLQMHDELIYELNEIDLDLVYDIVKSNMENALKFDVKMRVKVKIGRSWGNFKTYKC
jgi:DNA polymerase I-like protein with 3'-5' exonuclease and polymerase domains